MAIISIIEVDKLILSYIHIITVCLYFDWMCLLILPHWRRVIPKKRIKSHHCQRIISHGQSISKATVTHAGKVFLYTFDGFTIEGQCVGLDNSVIIFIFSRVWTESASAED